MNFSGNIFLLIFGTVAFAALALMFFFWLFSRWLTKSLPSQAESLRGPGESGSEAPKLTLIEPLIVGVYSEQRMRRPASQSLKLQGLSSLPKIWSLVQVGELQATLANLINEAFKADVTEVTLNLCAEQREWALEISGNGKGISADRPGKFCEQGGGSLEVSQTSSVGTTFTLRMPREKSPEWLPISIEVGIDQPIYFVDDDSNVLTAWRNKVQAAGLNNAHFLNSIFDLERRLSLKSWPADAILVIDQNLNEDKKGLDVLAEIGAGKRALLCTSEFDERWVQDQVRKLNGYLIPKLWISKEDWLPLRIRKGTQSPFP